VNAEFFDEQRREMVTAIRLIAEHVAPEIGKAALDERVLRAMAKVPRHEFVPVEVQTHAYLNRPIPIGFDKTISQPLMVAVMTDLLELKPDDVVLEIGTGLGYQAAMLAGADPSSPDQPTQACRKDGDPGRPARRAAACRGGERSERQGHNEGNYAGTVLGARGIRPACIPGILIKMIAESTLGSAPVFRIN